MYSQHTSSGWARLLVSLAVHYMSKFIVLIALRFLYSILGWSAWAGLGVMIGLAPLPAFVSTFMNSVQKEKMKATDQRVKYIKEVISILRMVKQFGWEKQVKSQIDAKREEELYWTFRRGLFGLVNMTVNYIVSSPVTKAASPTDPFNRSHWYTWWSLSSSTRLCKGSALQPPSSSRL
jgi:ABC-type bacteriocin/lantibiotic exporter with double-glycine peptidase domain